MRIVIDYSYRYVYNIELKIALKDFVFEHPYFSIFFVFLFFCSFQVTFENHVVVAKQFSKNAIIYNNLKLFK